VQGREAVLLRMSSGAVWALQWWFQLKAAAAEEILSITCLHHAAGRAA